MLPDTDAALARQQQNEINDFAVYTLLARAECDRENSAVLRRIANEERSHYRFLRASSGLDLKPGRFLVYLYLFLIKLFGARFALRLMERREDGAADFYRELSKTRPEATKIYEQETAHEVALIDMVKDDKLAYAGAIVLGMNDALVELTGTLSGIALAFDKSHVVGITGLIMGIAASLSMAGSAFLESRENPDPEISPLRYSLFTGVSYIITTLLLIMPFFLLESIRPALALMFTMALISILSYSFYITVAKGLSFKKRVLEMSAITFGVALISFGIGYAVKHIWGIDL